MQQIGRYEVLKELGRGAMGIVYSATDPLIQRQVAIKTIRLDRVEEGEARAELTRRLFREAQSAGILSHPGIITIYDLGELGTDAYIVMEFVDGRTLEEMMASGIPQRSGTLLSILQQAATALDYAHGKGIIHRDIKPSNIMICTDGTVKIADFGVAKLTDSTSMTQSGFVLGTPSYMSPEQAQGRTVDGRSDQFSLAVVAYRLITGKLPFEGPTLTALLTKILWEEPEYEGAGLHPSVRPAFVRALSKNPQLRFPTCTEFVQELESGYARHRAELRDRMESPVAPAPAPADTNSFFQSPDAPPLITRQGVESPAGQGDTAQPARETDEAGEADANSVENPLPPALSSSGITAKGRKRKPSLIAWAASLGILALAAVVFVAVRMNSSRPPPVPAPPPKDISVAQGKPAEPVREAVPIQAVESRKQAAAPKAPSPEPAVVPVPAERPSAPVSGVLTWSGRLGKNSVLVIGDRTASVGSIAGDLFPGKPVRIQVEPKDVVIRHLPSEANGWKQIMLYSDKQKYSTITISWEMVD